MNFSNKVNTFFKYMTKKDKILEYRKKHTALRHEYLVLANKYSDYNKTMLNFTIPSSIKGKTIKNGRYTKLKYLLKLRAFIAKEINNSKSDIKYFMNIELGKAYSNPHLHIQLWVSDTSSNAINLIYNKAIKKFELEESRCTITVPNEDTDDDYIFTYVIKDYGKHLSDKEVWDLEIQKKRMRNQIGSKVRFYSKSTDKYTKKIYRIFYKHYSCLRKYANEFISKFISMFFIKQIPQQKVFRESFSNLCVYRTRKICKLLGYFLEFIFVVISCCRDPPI